MMNRSEFMFRLAQLLADLSQSERSEALQYYQDYFDDAGPENEQRIIAELGSPEIVAASIKAGLSSEDSAKGEFSERGFSGYGEQNFDVPGRYRSKKAKFEQMKGEAGRCFDEFSEKFNDFSEKRRRFSGGQIALIVILVICASPILLGVGGAAVGIILGLFGGIIGIVGALLGSTVAFAIGGLAGFIGGAARCFSSPVSGMVTCGVGLISMAVGALLIILDIWVITRVCPAIWQGFVWLWHRIFNRRGEHA